MAEPRNIANAVLIVVGMYFLINENLGTWSKIGIIVLILFALGTWGYHFYPKENKKLVETQIKLEEAKILNYIASTRQLFVQSKLLERGLTPQ